MKSVGVFVLGLVIVIGVLQVIKRTQYANYAWLYVVIILLGMAVFNQYGLRQFGSDLQAKLKGA
jgi:hypothetical protein